MKTLCKILVLFLVCTLLLCGCNKNKEESAAEPNYDEMIQPPVDMVITDCLSTEALASIMGCPMQLLGLYEDNTEAIYMSEDNLHQVTVCMKNQTLAGFEAEKNNSPYEITLQDGVGEAAYWYKNEAGVSSLVFYSGGYSVIVSVMGSDADEQTHSVYTQQIADTILNKLPQGTTD